MRRKALIIDIDGLASATSDAALVSALAAQTGYWPVFSFLNSTNNLIDLASVELIGQKGASIRFGDGIPAHVDPSRPQLLAHRSAQGNPPGRWHWPPRRQHLISHWGYHPENITTLKDGPKGEVDDSMLPTRGNIVRLIRCSVYPYYSTPDHTLQFREIRNLVKGVQAGDRRVFFCV